MDEQIEDRWPELYMTRVDEVRVVTDPRIKPGQMKAREGSLSHVQYELVCHPDDVEFAGEMVKLGRWNEFLPKPKIYEEDDEC